jgi:HEAT repeat protein
MPFAQEKAEEILALDEARLIALVKDPQASTFARAKACQRLAVVGTKAAVPALAGLLGDAQLAHYARFGLEPIPDPSVDKALRAALKKLTGKLRVGAIDSLGVRRDAGAVKPLAELIEDRDADTSRAAAFALGGISGPPAAKALEKALRRLKPPRRDAAAEAALVCAEGLIAQGRQKEAMDLYARLGREDMPKPVRMAAGRARQ